MPSIIVSPPANLSAPIVVMDEAAVGRALGLADEVSLISITDVASNESAGQLLSQITKFEKQINDSRLEIKRPFLVFGKILDAAADKALEPLGTAKTALKGKLGEWFQLQEDKRKREAEEQRRIQMEAERVRLAAEAEQRRLEQESARRQAEAEAKVAAAKGAAARKKAEEELARQKAESDKKRMDAEAALKGAEEKAGEAQLVVESPQAATSKTKVKMKAVVDINDETKVPRAYLSVDMKKVQKAADAKIISTADGWLTVVFVPDVSSTGR